jgi:hypothetical protein
LAADRSARGRAQAAFAVLLGLSAGLFGLWAGLSSGLAWNAPQAVGGGQESLVLLAYCLALALLLGGAFWLETRLSGAGFALLLDQVEARQGEISTAYELCQRQPNQPFLPLLCRRLLEAPRSAEHWRAISPPAWVGALPLLLGATLALSALGAQGEPPAGLPELLQQSVRHLADAAARAPAGGPRRAADGQGSLAAAQELERQAWQRAQSTLSDLAHRAAAERDLAQLDAPLEEARRQLAALEARHANSPAAGAALAKAGAALDAAQYLSSQARGGPRAGQPRTGPGSTAGVSERASDPGLADPSKGPASAPGEPGRGPGAAPESSVAGAQSGTAGLPAPNGAPKPGDSGDARTSLLPLEPASPGAGTSGQPGPEAPALPPMSPDPSRSLLAAPGPTLSPAEERVVSAWLQAQRRPPAASGGF